MSENSTNQEVQQTSALETKQKEDVKQNPLEVELNSLKLKKDLSLSESLRKERLQKKIKAMQKRNSQMERIMSEYRAKTQSQNDKLMAKIAKTAQLIGLDDFKMLKDLYTKESGVNWYGLYQEMLNVVVLKRDTRIKNGKRKKTTGRSSRRKMHKSALNFISKRNTETKQKEDVKVVGKTE